MPSAREIKAGAAYVELFLHDNRFTRGLKLASKRLKSFGAGVGRIGRRMSTLGAGMLTIGFMAAKSFAKAGDTVHKMSLRTGLATEFLSGLGYAAEKGGSNLEGMEKVVRKLQKSAYDAGQGSKTVADAFGALGVSVHDASGQLKPTEALFLETAAALEKVENETLKSALANTLLGRSGTELIAVLDGFIENMREAKRVGAVITPKEAKEAADFTDIMYTLGVAVKRVVINFGQAIAGPLGEFAEWLTEKAVKLGQFVRENEELAITFLKVAAAAAVLGPALVVVGSMFTTVAAGISATIAILGALLTPIGLVVTAGVLLGATFLKVTGLGEKAFKSLKWVVGEAMEGVVDALSAGRIETAMELLWTNVELIWTEAIAGLKVMFLDLMADLKRRLGKFNLLLAAVAPKTGAVLQAGLLLLDIDKRRLKVVEDLVAATGKLQKKQRELFAAATAPTATAGKEFREWNAAERKQFWLPPQAAVAQQAPQMRNAIARAAQITTGTFSAEAAGRMGGAAAWQTSVVQTAKNTRDMAEDIHKMAGELEQGGMLVGAG